MLKFLFNKFYGVSLKLDSIFFLNLSFKLFNKPLIVRKAGEYYKINSEGESIYIHNLRRIYIYLDRTIGVKKRLDHLFDEYFLNDIQFNDKDIVVDCGAHLGELSYYFKDKKIIYYAFEPSSTLQTCLEINVKSNIKDYEIINRPLLDVEKQVKLYLRDDSGDTSIEKDYESESESVESLKLDNFFDRNVKIKLLKIDAEGYELEVLNGSLNIFKNIEYISVDLGFEREKGTVNTFDSVNKLLTENNFKFIKPNKIRMTYLYQNLK